MNDLSRSDLHRLLISLQGKPDTEYAKLAGSHEYDDFTLKVDYVPDQPDLHSCRIRIAVPLKTAKFPRDVFTPKCREVAARDFLARQFNANAPLFAVSMRGMSGGVFDIDRPGQELLETNAVVVGDDVLEVRCGLELPVIRKRIPEEALIDLFLRKLPGLVHKSLTYEGVDRDVLVRWIEVNEDADVARGMLDKMGLAAFISNGSLLAWKGPNERREIVPVTAPEELAVTLELPNRGTVTGLGIRKGVTVVTGGWRQGKSTLLKTLGLGVYNHIPGDGREVAITVGDATVIRAEEGRKIERVDLSSMLPPEPGAKAGAPFSTTFATSGVSMAANLMEALEIGTSLLLFDDETSALPLYASDAVSRELIPESASPRPLSDILPLLRDQHGISSVIVGASEELFAIADTVIMADRFLFRDVTARVRDIAKKKGCAAFTPKGSFPLPRNRSPLSRTLEPPKHDRKKQQPVGRDIVQYGDEFLDLSGLPQLVSKAQVRAIGRAISLVDRLLDGSPSLKDAIQRVLMRMNQIGLDTLSNKQAGDLARFRAQELAGAINRMKQLKIK